MKIKSLLAVALFGCAFGASAQFTGNGSKSGNASRSGFADTNPYNRISLSYDFTNLSTNDKAEGYFMGEDSMGLNGFGLEYTHGFSVSKTLPMFVEAGIKAQIGFGSVTESDDLEGYDLDYVLKMQQLSFSIPVNYTYRFAVGDEMNIAPYLGLNFKLHAMTRMKSEVKFDDSDLQDYWDDEYGDDEEWVSVFDKDKIEDTWNRFQLGWQIGAGFSYKAFYIGLQYGTDFIPAFKHKKYAINSGNFTAKIGLNF